MINYFGKRNIRLKVLAIVTIISGAFVNSAWAVNYHANYHALDKNNKPCANNNTGTGQVSSVNATNNVDTNAANILYIKGKNATVNASNDVTTNAINDIYVKGSVKQVETSNNVSTDANNVIYIKGKNATVNASNSVTTNAVNDVVIK